MAALIPVAHPELYHYTTAAGLAGIIESQQIWATDISYLNDAEEHVGFFHRRLPQILDEPVRAGVSAMQRHASGKRFIRDAGGAQGAARALHRALIRSLESASLRRDHPYVSSFCSPPSRNPPDDGLLSQWRGYGWDGGYAIVLGTVALNRLLEEEARRFGYQALFGGKVEYFDGNSKQAAPYPEALEWVSIVQKAAEKFILTNDPAALESIHDPMAMLSCLHKHGGFQEETEIRIVAMPLKSGQPEPAPHGGKPPIRKPVHFLAKNGMLVPYIRLFGDAPDAKPARLPIRKVIVGPHPDRRKRQRAVEMLLAKHQVDAPVVVSDIPYLGR